MKSPIALRPNPDPGHTLIPELIQDLLTRRAPVSRVGTASLCAGKTNPHWRHVPPLGAPPPGYRPLLGPDLPPSPDGPGDTTIAPILSQPPPVLPPPEPPR